MTGTGSWLGAHEKIEAYISRNKQKIEQDSIEASLRFL